MDRKSTKNKKHIKIKDVEKGTKVESVGLKNVVSLEIGVDISIVAIDMFAAIGSPREISVDEAIVLTSAIQGIDGKIMVDRRATVEYVYWAAISEYAAEFEKNFCGKDLPSKSSPTRLAVVEGILLQEMPDEDKLAYLPQRIKAYKARKILEKDKEPKRKDDAVDEVTAFFRQALATGKMPRINVKKETEKKPDRFDLVIQELEEELNNVKIKQATMAC